MISQLWQYYYRPMYDTRFSESSDLLKVATLGK